MNAVNLALAIRRTAFVSTSVAAQSSRQRVVCIRAFASKKSLLLSTKDNTNHHHAPLPIAVFIDLDNVAPTTHRRDDAKKFITPLLELGKHINGRTNNNNDTTISNKINKFKPLNNNSSSVMVHAFGNLSTRTYIGSEERSHTLDNQEYIPHQKSNDNDNDDDDDQQYVVAQTGYDNDNILRCGVCGRRITLTKRNKRQGRTAEQKLRQHMKIHTKEQNKRNTHIQMKRNKGHVGKRAQLSEKEMNKYHKYKAAMVGLKHQPKLMKVTKSGKVVTKTGGRGGGNDLFRILNEVGVKVKPNENVDEAILLAASQWMNKVSRLQNKNGRCGGDTNIRGVLVIYSKDADFVPLLQRAKKKGFLTVSMSDEEKQSRMLVSNCDVLVGPLPSFENWMINDREDTTTQRSDISTLLSGDDDVDDIDAVDRKDENDDEEEGGYEIRDVGSAPISLLSSSAQSSVADGDAKKITAISISDNGHKFMIRRDRHCADQKSGDTADDADSAVAQWDLGIGYSYPIKTEEASDEVQKLPSMKQLQRQHIDKTSQYNIKGPKHTKHNNHLLKRLSSIPRAKKKKNEKNQPKVIDNI